MATCCFPIVQWVCPWPKSYTIWPSVWQVRSGTLPITAVKSGLIKCKVQVTSTENLHKWRAMTRITPFHSWSGGGFPSQAFSFQHEISSLAWDILGWNHRAASLELLVHLILRLKDWDPTWGTSELSQIQIRGLAATSHPKYVESALCNGGSVMCHEGREDCTQHLHLVMRKPFKFHQHLGIFGLHMASKPLPASGETAWLHQTRTAIGKDSARLLQSRRHLLSEKDGSFGC